MSRYYDSTGDPLGVTRISCEYRQMKALERIADLLEFPKVKMKYDDPKDEKELVVIIDCKFSPSPKFPFKFDGAYTGQRFITVMCDCVDCKEDRKRYT